MSRSENHFLVVDLGNRNIKLVNGKIHSKKIEIINYDIFETPQNSIGDGKILNAKAIVDSLKESIRKNKIRPGRLILNISGTGVITREIELPKSSESEIESMIEFEAQQYFPVDLSSYILDFKILEEITNPDGIFYRILLVAVPEKQAEDYMVISRLLGVEIAAIDLPANCITKFLFGNTYLKPENESTDLPKEFAVLDIGAETTSVCIYCNNKLKFNRILLIGSSDIDKQIAYLKNLDFKEAEGYKIQKAKIYSEAEQFEDDTETIEISTIVKNVISNLIEDLNRFFEFYNSRNPDNSIRKIYICGGGSKLQGLDNYLSNVFGVPVGALNTSCFNIEYLGKKDIDELSQDFVFLINAIGGIVRV